MIYTDKGALVSPCGLFRYRLWRRWDDQKPVLVWIMLNPSTADGNLDDPTIKKCVGFADRWGYGGIEVVNLFAYRTKSPAELFAAGAPYGPDNRKHVRHVLGLYQNVIVAWGGNVEKAAGREAVALMHAAMGDVLTADAPEALKLSSKLTPWHPLYVPYNIERVHYSLEDM